MLGWPKSAAQHLDRRYLVDMAKVAMELEARPYTEEEVAGDVVSPEAWYSREEIAEKVRRVMSDHQGAVPGQVEGVRKNVQKLRPGAREAGSQVDSSRRNFDTYVTSLS